MTRGRVSTREPGWLALTAKILRRVPSLRGALCAGRPEMFDGAGGRHSESTRAAIALCRQCPALHACETWADTLPQSWRPPGVVAGRYRRSASVAL